MCRMNQLSSLRWFLVIFMYVQIQTEKIPSAAWREAVRECRNQNSTLGQPTNGTPTYWIDESVLLMFENEEETFVNILYKNKTVRYPILCINGDRIIANKTEMIYSEAEESCSLVTLSRNRTVQVIREAILDENTLYWIKSANFKDYTSEEIQFCPAIDNGTKVNRSCEEQLPYECQRQNLSIVVRIYKNNNNNNNNKNNDNQKVSGDSISTDYELHPLHVIIPVLGGELIIIAAVLLVWRAIRKRARYVSKTWGTGNFKGGQLNMNDLYSTLPTLSLSEELGLVCKADDGNLEATQIKEGVNNTFNTRTPNSFRLAEEIKGRHQAKKDGLEVKNNTIERRNPNSFRLMEEIKERHQAKKDGLEVKEVLNEQLSNDSKTNRSQDDTETKKPPIPEKPSVQKRLEMQRLLTEFKKRQIQSVIHTKIEPDKNRSSRVTNVLEVIEIESNSDHIEQHGYRCTYVDMADIKRPTSDYSYDNDSILTRSSNNTTKEKDPDYEDMKKLCKYRKLTDKSNSSPNQANRNCQMFTPTLADCRKGVRCSVLQRDEPILYEIETEDTKAILGNLQKKDSATDIIWNIQTSSANYTYRTSKANAVFSRQHTSEEGAEKEHSERQSQCISLFFHEPPKTDSIGTCSDLYRISYVTALDGVYRTSVCNQTDIKDINYAYLIDGEPFDMIYDSKTVDEMKRYCNEPVDETSFNLRQSLDSGCNLDNADNETTGDNSHYGDKKDNTIYINFTELNRSKISNKNKIIKSQHTDSNSTEIEGDKILHVQLLPPADATGAGVRSSTILIDYND